MAEIPDYCVRCFFLVTLVLSRFAQGIHFCSSTTVKITGESSGEIKTLLKGETNYGNNKDCVWVLDAGVNKRVWLEVLSSQLQWAPSNAICTGYDYVEIRDGSDSTSREIINWCGSHKPQYVSSSGRYLYLRFKSNSQNIYSYAGVHFRFGTHDQSLCPPFSNKWVNGTETLCIAVIKENVTWNIAQQHCGWVQSNLVVIYTEDMAAFVSKLIMQNASQTSYWIGLHDIARESKFLWIDGTKPKFDRLSENSGSDKDDCVSVSTSSNVWSETNCDAQKPFYVCSMPVDGPFTIYSIPKEGEYPEDPMPPASPLVIGLVSAAAIFVIVIVVIVVLVVYCNIKKKRQRRPSEKRHTSSDTELDHTTQPINSPTTGTGRYENRVNIADGNTQVQTTVLQHPADPGNSSSRSPSAPAYAVDDPQPSSQEIAPPAYDEAMGHRVFIYSPSNI